MLFSTKIVTRPRAHSDRKYKLQEYYLHILITVYLCIVTSHYRNVRLFVNSHGSSAASTVIRTVVRRWHSSDRRVVYANITRTARAHVDDAHLCAMKQSQHRRLLAHQRQLTEAKQLTGKLDSRLSRLEQVRSPEPPCMCVVCVVLTSTLCLAGGANIGRADATAT